MAATPPPGALLPTDTTPISTVAWTISSEIKRREEGSTVSLTVPSLTPAPKIMSKELRAFIDTDAKAAGDVHWKIESSNFIQPLKELEQAIFKAIALQKINFLEELIDLGVNVNVLAHAVKVGQAPGSQRRIVKVTPLYYTLFSLPLTGFQGSPAQYANARSMIFLLLKANASVDPQNAYGEMLFGSNSDTFLHRLVPIAALEHDFLSILELALKHTGDINRLNANGNTILMSMVKNHIGNSRVEEYVEKWVPVVKLLLTREDHDYALRTSEGEKLFTVCHQNFQRKDVLGSARQIYQLLFEDMGRWCLRMFLTLDKIQYRDIATYIKYNYGADQKEIIGVSGALNRWKLCSVPSVEVEGKAWDEARNLILEKFEQHVINSVMDEVKKNHHLGAFWFKKLQENQHLGFPFEIWELIKNYYTSSLFFTDGHTLAVHATLPPDLSSDELYPRVRSTEVLADSIHSVSEKLESCCPFVKGDVAPKTEDEFSKMDDELLRSDTTCHNERVFRVSIPHLSSKDAEIKLHQEKRNPEVLTHSQGPGPQLVCYQYRYAKDGAIHSTYITLTPSKRAPHTHTVMQCTTAISGSGERKPETILFLGVYKYDQQRFPKKPAMELTLLDRTTTLTAESLDISDYSRGIVCTAFKDHCESSLSVKLSKKA